MNQELILLGDAYSDLRPGASFVLRGSELEWLDENTTPPTQEEAEERLTELRAQVPWNELRQQRNRLIAETDYLALSDATLTDEMSTYRQALRDLPANTTDPANPVWPTKPGA